MNIFALHKTDKERMSEDMFIGLCCAVGTSQQINMRRDVVDLGAMLVDLARTSDDDVLMISGSFREGFRLKGSDIDSMQWPNNYRVIWELSQSQYYNIHKTTPILCDCSDSPPGFTMLYLLSPSKSKTIQRACVRMNNRHYISSSKHRQLMCPGASHNYTPHGPCVSRCYGVLSADHAYCFASDFWPPCASSWLDRSRSWPQPHIGDDIVKNGCHFVAIGNKLGRHEHNEWRISFSLAEQKLVYAMNHCQFLTYGLLKLFLKRIINNELGDDDKLLCSYHMKTAIFWTIQQNIIPHWCPQNLLECFWICFKRILKWVYEGVCPNFFVPSNNMFLSNIYGRAQNDLFTRLYELYEQGLESLLGSLSIRSCKACKEIFQNSRPWLFETKLDEKLFEEISKNDSLPASNLQSCMRYLHAIERKIGSTLSPYHVITLQKFTVSVLQKLAFILHLKSYAQENKRMYVADKKSCHFLKLAARFGCISDMLYIAMYYYKTLRYKKALLIIEVIKVKLAQPYVMHNFEVDPGIYTKAVGGQSWCKKMRQTAAWTIKLNNEVHYISELIPEQQSALQNIMPHLIVPPFILLHMFETFCHRYIGTMRAQTALDDLQTLVHYDQGQIIPHDVNISWHILGICQQQITGNLQDALYSYKQSLKHD